MATDRDKDVPDTDQETEAQGAQKHSQGDVDHWRERNVEDEERGTVTEERRTLTEATGREQEDQAVPGPTSAGRDEDNLVQLPVGAKFGLDHEPSPQEREELLRFAAEADAEMRGQGADGGDQDAGE